MRFIIFYIFFLINFSASAQEYTYAHYDIKDGLAGSTVYCSVQDKDGFMWFGSETGLSRFDGTRFVNFGIKDGLPDNEVLNLFCDSQNRIWCSLFKQAICYVLNGKIYNQYNDSTLSKIFFKGIAWQICEDKHGNILIREDKLLHLITTSGQVRELHTFSNNDSSSLFSAISQSANGNFFVFQNDKVYELNYNGKTDVIKKINPNAPFTNLALLSPNFILLHSDPFLYTAYSFSTKNKLVFKNPSGLIRLQILKDSFICINKINGCSIQNFYTLKKLDNILPKEQVSSVFADGENNLWFTTLGHGIFRLGSTEFKTLPLTRKNGNRVSIFSLQKDKNKILAGADGNYLFSINAENAQNYRRYKFHYFGEVKARPISLQILNDTLYMGSDEALYKIVNFKIKRIVRYLNVKKLLLFNNDSLLVAHKDNLLLFDSHTLKILDTLINERTTCLSFLNDDLYIGTLNGLIIKNLRTQAEAKFNIPGLQTRITALEKDVNGILWIGTYGAGIFACKDGKILRSFNEEDGLSSNICRCITPYKNNIWIGTDKGITKILLTPKPTIQAKFTNTDGLPSNMINVILQDSNTVFVGTPNGITYFTDNLKISDSKCILHITNIFSGLDTLAEDNLKLQPSQNNISFEYIAISYNSGGDIKYYYRIKGLEKENWTTTTNLSVTYPSLPAGKYVFEIKAINKYGLWSQTISIPFEIEKHLWNKLWIQAMFFSLTGLAIWLLVQKRIKNIRRKETEKSNTVKQIAELKQKAVKSQMAPHFIFNCLNSIQEYIVDKDVEGSNRFISRFSELIRKTLDFSEKQEIPIKEELDYLNLYLLLERERFEGKFQFKITFGSRNEIENNYIPPLILQPLVENAVKHGVRARDDCKGLIEIIAYVSDLTISLIVKDNGPGIFSEEDSKKNLILQHNSMGMLLVKDRINALNGVTGKKASILINEINKTEYYRGTIIKIEIAL
jgi:ligand-binding sensor domain-containing protein